MTWTLGEVRKRRVGGTEILVARGGWMHIVPLSFRNQAAFTVVMPSGEHDIAIRKIDEDLIRLALVTTTAA